MPIAFFTRFAGATISCVVFLSIFGCQQVSLETKNISEIAHHNFDGAYISYFLPRAELPVNVTFDGKTTGLLSLSAGPISIVPDFSRHYHIVYNHADLSTDEISVTTDANGLLKEVSSKTTDQSVQLVQQVNAILSQVGALEKAAQIQTVAPSETPKAAPIPDCPDDLKTVVNVDLTYLKKPQQIRQWSAVCEVKISAKIDLVDDLQARGFPTESQIASKQPTCDQVVCFRIFGAFRIHISAALYRKGSKEPIRVAGRELATSTDVEVLAPMPSPTGFIRFKRRNFVSNSTTASFTNGMLTGFKSSDPSETVGFLALPLELLKTVTILVTL